VRPEGKNLLLGMLTGAVIGVASALLLAPMSGPEARSRLKEKSAEAKQKAQEAISKGREYLTAKGSEIREAIRRGKEAAQQTRAELESEIKPET